MKYRNLLKRMAALSLSGMMLLSAVPVQAEEGEQPVAETAADAQTADEGIPETDVPTEELVTEDVENAADDTTVYAEEGVPVDEAHFPDPVFREFVGKYALSDGVLSEQESRKITYIDLADSNVTSLKGIEYLPWITYLMCRNNQIKSLELTNHPELIRVWCENNGMTSLDVSGCPNLERFGCDNNELTSLDLSNNPKLTGVWARECKSLKNLDVSNHAALKEVWVSMSGLSSLDVSGCPELESIAAMGNELTSLDLSSNPKLFHVTASENKLKSIDLSQNENLHEFFCDSNELTELDLSHNPKLTNLVCSNNHLTYLNLNNNQDLNILFSSYQYVSLEAYQKDGKWVVSMPEYIGEDGELSRVEVWDEGFSYDASTGLLTLPDDKVEKLEYTYKSTDKEFESDGEYMWVEATVTYDENGGEEEQEKLPFEDVREGDWFYDNVAYVYYNKLMTGLKETVFGPSDSLARAQFAVILHRMEGTPAAEGSAEFPDVEAGIWYDEAVSWASEAGVVSGYSDGRFGPNDNINREQMAVMMYRYAKYKGFDVSETADFGKFADASNVNEFAKEAMQWAVGTGIISGKENGTRIDPQGNAVRAECATIIQRFRTYYGL